jgi:DNA-binding IclR family transcriptional regulator
MTAKSDKATDAEPKEGPTYQAPALEKGLDILELLARSDRPLSRTEIANRMQRSVGEIYRMLHQLVKRNYLIAVNDCYTLTTKLFELSHYYPPTQRLLIEAEPIMHKLAGDIAQACHLTVYSQGTQIVVAKVDCPTGMGFSVRLGSELQVLISSSGRVLISFQEEETRELRIAECLENGASLDRAAIDASITIIRQQGYEAAPSGQVNGLFAISFPILDLSGNAIAALTVPYADRLDQTGYNSAKEVTVELAAAAKLLTSRVCGRMGN